MIAAHVMEWPSPTAVLPPPQFQNPVELSPYEQWWELSTLGAETPVVTELARIRRQRWWWLLGGVAAGFAAGSLIYVKV